MLNRLTQVNLGCFLCLLFNWFFFKLSFKLWLVGNWASIYFDSFVWECLDLEIKVTGFGIITLVKSDFFFLSKRLNWSHYLGHEFFNIGLAFYWVVPILWLQVNLNDLFSLSFINWFFSFQFHQLILCLIEN